jgi:hypothetical protein
MVFKTFFSGEQPPVASAVQFSCFAIVIDNGMVSSHFSLALPKYLHREAL